jgi:hypothetical protein
MGRIMGYHAEITLFFSLSMLWVRDFGKYGKKG